MKWPFRSQGQVPNYLTLILVPNHRKFTSTFNNITIIWIFIIIYTASLPVDLLALDKRTYPTNKPNTPIAGFTLTNNNTTNNNTTNDPIYSYTYLFILYSL